MKEERLECGRKFLDAHFCPEIAPEGAEPASPVQRGPGRFHTLRRLPLFLGEPSHGHRRPKHSLLSVSFTRHFPKPFLVRYLILHGSNYLILPVYRDNALEVTEQYVGAS